MYRCFGTRNIGNGTTNGTRVSSMNCTWTHHSLPETYSILKKSKAPKLISFHSKHMKSEINTSMLTRTLKKTFPSLTVLLRFPSDLRR